ncbi:response regulator transcription factor [Serratia marcescens]|uniref:response regulator transcription factor n=1 Tax=Serratia marcescens TaxID=615 RepID=UPI00320AF746
MWPEIVIKIEDENRYFAEGLRYCLRNYFLQRGTKVVFSDVDRLNRQPNLVFTSLSAYRQPRYCVTHALNNEVKTLFFTIKTGVGRNVYARKAGTGYCTHKAGEIYRYQSCQALYSLLDDTLALVAPLLDRMHSPCVHCRKSTLSVREREVVRHLRSGLSQAQAAACMHLSVKTVHTYKRSIMSKMLLKKKHEFIYWLLAGNNRMQ